MSQTTSPDLAYLLFRANEADVGISIITNNPQLLRNKLYAERKRLGFDHLSIVQPPVGSATTLWIIKKEEKDYGATEG